MAAPRKRGGKVIMPNATVYDADLSYRALGLLMAMLARPATASFDMRELANDDEYRPGREGRGALLTAVRELREKGYVHTFQIPRSGRKGVITKTVVTPEPITEEEARKRGSVPSGSKLQGSENCTPQNQTPVDPTPLPTEGHPPTSLRSLEGNNTIIAREAECPHRCNASGHYDDDEGLTRRCPLHHPRARRTA